MSEIRGRDRAALTVVYGTVFLDLLGFGIILPSLPYFAVALEGGTAAGEGLDLGLVLTAYSLAQLFGSAMWGRLSDRMGRRPILLICLAGSAIAMVLSGLAASLVALVAARALAGLFGGSISTAQAYIADVTEPEERARFMGMLGATIGLGFVLGPALGVGVLALGGTFRETAFVAAGLAAINLLFGLLRLREPDRERSRRRLGFLGQLGLLRRPRLASVVIASFLTTFAFVAMETTFALFGKDAFDLRERGFGLILVGIGFVMVLVQGGLVGRVSRRFGERKVAIAGAVLMAASLAGLPLSPTLATAAGVLAILAVGRGLVQPTLSSLNSRLAAGDEQGAALGLGQSAAAGARAVGPIVAGSLFDLSRAAPYFLAAALGLAAALLLAARGRSAEVSDTLADS